MICSTVSRDFSIRLALSMTLMFRALLLWSCSGPARPRDGTARIDRVAADPETSVPRRIRRLLSPAEVYAHLKRPSTAGRRSGTLGAIEDGPSKKTAPNHRSAAAAQ